jgi:hypothetical protein
MFKRKIRTIEDVEQFFEYLVKTLHLNFHPDTDFSEYINIGNGNNTFSPQEAKKLNAAMTQCVKLCKTAKKDIYEIGFNCLQNTYKSQN